MEKKLNTITIYAGSADGLADDYLTVAFKLGELLAKQGRSLVFGSGKTGLMGAVAKGALSLNGEVIGVINEDLNLPHLVFERLSRIEEVSNIQIRQARMIELGDGLIALPGGFGTYYEVLEALTLAQLGQHKKPIGFLNFNGFYEPLIQMIDHAIETGFIYREHRGLFVVADQPEELLAKMDAFTPPSNMNRWINRDE